SVMVLPACSGNWDDRVRADMCGTSEWIPEQCLAELRKCELARGTGDCSYPAVPPSLSGGTGRMTDENVCPTGRSKPLFRHVGACPGLRWGGPARSSIVRS